LPAALPRLSLTPCLTLPPKQRIDYQVEFGGEIRLACGRGLGISTQHKQATSRQAPQIPTGQMPKLPPDPIARHGRANSAAYNEADLGRLAAAAAAQKVTGEQRPTSAAATADSLGELGPPPHPGGRGKHGQSPPCGRCALVRG